MNREDDDDLGRLLGEAFTQRAHHAVGDDRLPPAPRFATLPPPAKHRHLARLAVPLSAAALVIALVGIVVVVTGGPGRRPDVAGQARPTRHVTTSAAANVPTRGVRIVLADASPGTVGVGMPVVAYFSRRITDASALASATRADANGQPLSGAWYFVRSSARKGFPIEGHFRTRSFWPATSAITVSMPVRGLSAGTGMTFSDDARMRFRTDAGTVATVRDATHQLTVVRDHRTIAHLPVSLGASNTPTDSGIKVVMAKGTPLCMSGPGYNECGIKYTQRLTYAGEYLHAAPWNAFNIGKRDTSNGCTNLSTAGARFLYHHLNVGDVVRYPDANGPAMTLDAGYGDWNVPWSTWSTGGVVATR